MSLKHRSVGFLPQQNCAKCAKNCRFMFDFSLEEWTKGPGVSVCNECIIASALRLTERRNRAIAAEYYDEELEKPFAQGGFRYAAKGVYSEGDRKGQACVCKWFIKESYESRYLEAEMRTAKEAIRLVSEWNAKKYIDRIVRINLPEIWTFDDNDHGRWAGRRVFQEPFIENYEKFNSNNGWVNEKIPWARVMQAISHFSYHATHGERLLCDLQGAVYRDGVVLTDPAIMSNGKGGYGPTDLGEKGISSFFASHVCNEFCKSAWLRPTDRRCYYPRRCGSTMEHVSSRASRPSISRQAPRKKRRKNVEKETGDDESDEDWNEGDE